MSNKANASQTQAKPLQQHLWNKTLKKVETAWNNNSGEKSEYVRERVLQAPRSVEKEGRRCCMCQS